jgi:hypothetical protein
VSHPARRPGASGSSGKGLDAQRELESGEQFRPERLVVAGDAARAIDLAGPGGSSIVRDARSTIQSRVTLKQALRIRARARAKTLARSGPGVSGEPGAVQFILMSSGLPPL